MLLYKSTMERLPGAPKQGGKAKDYDYVVVLMQIELSVIWTGVIFPGELTLLICLSCFPFLGTICYFVQKAFFVEV